MRAALQRSAAGVDPFPWRFLPPPRLQTRRRRAPAPSPRPGALRAPLAWPRHPLTLPFCHRVTPQVICHGIPDAREMQDGDIVNVDVTAYIGGYHGDLNETFCVGKVGSYVIYIPYICYFMVCKS